MNDADEGQADRRYMDRRPRQEGLEHAVKIAALEAGHYLKAMAYRYTGLKWKKTDDPVTDMDKQAEWRIREYFKDGIERFGVNVNLIGEEHDDDQAGSKTTIYIDPIDGTKSFIRGEFFSSVSIAAEYDGKLIAGCVYDFMKDTMYFAGPKGAWLSTYEIDSMPKETLKLRMPLKQPKFSKLSVAFNDWEFGQQLLGKNPEYAVRNNIGSVALSMAQLAAGTYDGLVMKPFKKDGLHDTCDIAAGYFIMKQAGLYITDFAGNPYDHRNPSKGIIALKPEHKDRILNDIGR